MKRQFAALCGALGLFSLGTSAALADVTVLGWPGGPEDRTERAALDWLRHGQPEQINAELPVCSCSTGRCVLCN